MCKDGQAFSSARDGNSCLRSAACLSRSRSPHERSSGLCPGSACRCHTKRAIMQRGQWSPARLTILESFLLRVDDVIE